MVVKSQECASAKRIPAKHNATPEKQAQRNDEAQDEAFPDINASSYGTRLKQQKYAALPGRST